MGAWRHVGRGLRLRCPGCGKGRIYRSFFSVRDACAECGLVYQRDPGDWSGGAEIVVIASVLLAAAAFFVIRVTTAWSARVQLAVVLGASLVVVPLLYRVVKGFWIGVVRAWEGPDPQPSPVQDPEWFTALWDNER